MPLRDLVVEMREYATAYDDEPKSPRTGQLLSHGADSIAKFSAAIEGGAQLNTPDLMDWIAERLVRIHGENPHVDYILSLRLRADGLRDAIE